MCFSRLHNTLLISTPPSGDLRYTFVVVLHKLGKSPPGDAYCRCPFPWPQCVRSQFAIQAPDRNGNATPPPFGLVSSRLPIPPFP